MDLEYCWVFSLSFLLLVFLSLWGLGFWVGISYLVLYYVLINVFHELLGWIDFGFGMSIWVGLGGNSPHLTFRVFMHVFQNFSTWKEIK